MKKETFKVKVQFQSQLSVLHLYCNNFLGFQVHECTSEKYFRFSERQKCSKSCPEPRKKLHVLDYSCSCCWAECPAGSNSYTNCGFYSLFPPSSSFSRLSFFAHVASRCFPLTLNRCFTVKFPLWICITVTRGSVFLSLSRPPCLCCDNKKRRSILMEFHTDGTVVQEPKEKPYVIFGQMENCCFQLMPCS